jgi:hypothetical protein
MARHTHTLDVRGRNVFAASDIEERRLPDLEVTVRYQGKPDEERVHVFSGKAKIHDKSKRFLSELPAKLAKMETKELAIRGKNKRDSEKEAIDWAELLVEDFLKSGFFSYATVIYLDSDGTEKKRYEYHPELRVVSAKVYSM